MMKTYARIDYQYRGEVEIPFCIDGKRWKETHTVWMTGHEYTTPANAEKMANEMADTIDFEHGGRKYRDITVTYVKA